MPNKGNEAQNHEITYDKIPSLLREAFARNRVRIVINYYPAIEQIRNSACEQLEGDACSVHGLSLLDKKGRPNKNPLHGSTYLCVGSSQGLNHHVLFLMRRRYGKYDDPTLYVPHCCASEVFSGGEGRFFPNRRRPAADLHVKRRVHDKVKSCPVCSEVFNSPNASNKLNAHQKAHQNEPSQQHPEEVAPLPVSDGVARQTNDAVVTGFPYQSSASNTLASSGDGSFSFLDERVAQPFLTLQHYQPVSDAELQLPPFVSSGEEQHAAANGGSSDSDSLWGSQHPFLASRRDVPGEEDIGSPQRRAPFGFSPSE